MLKHPTNRAERISAEIKHSEKKKKKDSRVWRKLAEEQLKVKESEDAIKEAKGSRNLHKP